MPPFLLQLIRDLHTGTTARVRTPQGMSDVFYTTSGVRQGCIVAPALFCCAIDWLMRHCSGCFGVDVGNFHLTDINYADDAVLFTDYPTCCERSNCQVWSSKSDCRSYITLITVVCLLQYRRLEVDRSSASALAAECGQLCIFCQYSALAKCKNNPSAKPLASASFCHHIRGVSAAVYTCHIVHFAPFTTREVLCTR